MFNIEYDISTLTSNFVYNTALTYSNFKKKIVNLLDKNLNFV